MYTGTANVYTSEYASGTYFTDSSRHSEDAGFKAREFLSLFQRCRSSLSFRLTSYVDVGCGSGDIVDRVAGGLRQWGYPLTSVKGYDVSPHVTALSSAGVEFVHGDFCESRGTVDLVTLFDVFEHVPGPIEFLKEVSLRSKIVGLHIPLDNNLNGALRDLFRPKLKDPGHLLFMDAAMALNMLTLAGLRVMDYKYTYAFEAPSGRSTLLSRLFYPLRWLVSRISPWLLSKTLGGASLMVLAVTPQYAGKSLGVGK
jgi:SAM-dependent methyltransferase